MDEQAWHDRLDSTADDPDLFRGDGTEWNVATGESADGRTLTRLPARWTFAFSWQTDHGTDRLYDHEQRHGASSAGSQASN